MLLKVLGVLMISTLFSAAPKEKLVEVKIEISNLRNTEGVVRLGLFKDDESFDAEEAYLKDSFSKANAKNGRLNVTMKLPKGTYGIALMDDENNNGEMDYSWLMPEEGFGFSNYWHTGIIKPSVEDFSFTVTAATEVVKIKVKYL